MPQSYDLLFATSNGHKFDEASRILAAHNILLGRLDCALEEIQSDSVLEISAHKARYAFGICRCPVIVEDDALQVSSLGGFPGPYSSYVFDTIGNDGILRLVGDDRAARFVSVVSYCDLSETRSFEGAVDGELSDIAKGSGWGYDPIFIPHGSAHTFAESHNKDSASHRGIALGLLTRWLADR